MCGIAGLIDASASAAELTPPLQRMLDAMVHRGPDDEGVSIRDGAAIGMRRLAIFDPANGRQPMVSADGRHHLVFNGAIYNHRELRAELEAAGQGFATHCDTEVLLVAWRQWGEKSLARLRGMFAFAVWDTAERSLFLARDPLGIKPLYYSEQGGRLLFASELNAMLASGCLDDAVDPEAVDAFLARLGIPAPLTFYRAARSLQPGEWARWREGKLVRQIYWRFPQRSDAEPGREMSDTEFAQALRLQLEDTVRAHSLADVKVGAFLSGGIDSAVITGLMAQATGERLSTFSIGFPETRYSESNQAAATARHFGTDHHDIQVTGGDAAAKLPDFLAALDQPTGDGFNTFIVSCAAREGGITAALSGLGGDELFGGYESFREVPRLARGLGAWRSIAPAAVRAGAGRLLTTRGTAVAKLGGMLEHARDIHDVADLRREVFTHEARRALLPGLATQGETFRHPANAFLRESLAGAEPLAIVSAWELRGYMNDVLLRDSDVFSMRASLELRVPFVDRPLLEWLWRQPAARAIDATGGKALLRAATQDLLPPTLLQPRRKQGFVLPFPEWMRGPLRPFIEDTLATGSTRASGLLDPAEVERRWHAFRDGGDNKQWSRVWSLVVLTTLLQRRPRS